MAVRGSRGTLAELTRSLAVATFVPRGRRRGRRAGARLGEEIAGRSGPPDLLINNAAIINQTAPLWEVPADEFDRVIDIDIKGTANVLRHFLPAMVQCGQAWS